MRRTLAILTLSLFPLLAGCGVYRQDIRQGNFISDDLVSQLKPGMTHDQVKFLLGEPMVENLFRDDRWDYVYYLDSWSRDKVTEKHLTVYFEGGKVSRIDKPAAEQDAKTQS